ncbi:MAG: D-arabinose 5-phosphate isomerase [Pseudopedobacter saltans]|uniref:D-arabinose 5-phosphate isomerase n=1 Tax=Pseudopedobacter saltans TaxID=151895 RepID=A0A2W5GWN1_9SPHI|nr:MAG: D-arabinose 5-phosphate isomerase [Pseudopedobacter saltans]
MSDKIAILECAKQVFAEEAESISRIGNSLDTDFSDVVEVLYQCKGRIVVSGIGKSAIIAQKIVATFNSTGTPAIFLHAAEAIHGDLGIIQKEDIVILVSKSGESPEIRNLASILKSWNNTVIALSSNKDSHLCQYADHALLVPIEKEACPFDLAPTTSTTAQLVMGDALAVSLMHLRDFSKDDFARLHPGGSLGKRLLLSLGDIYIENATPKVWLDSTLKEVLSTISQGRLGAVAVVDKEDVVLGIVTDGDIRRLLQKVDDINTVHAKAFYTSGGYIAEPNMLAVSALEMMKENDISQLMIVDNEKHFLGFVHLHDLVKEGLG